VKSKGLSEVKGLNEVSHRNRTSRERRYAEMFDKLDPLQCQRM
jgi:hypothetical protein